MGIYFVKNVIEGVNLVKIGHFGENGPNWVVLWAELTSYVKIWEICQIIFSLNLLKIVTIILFVKNIINGVNLVIKIVHFW